VNTAVQASIADRLGSTLFLAALGHGVVILGITFTTDPLPETTELPSLNVTLLADSLDAERNHSEARQLAQRDQAGGGATSEARRASTTLAAEQPFTQLGDKDGADLDDATPREPAPSTDRIVANRNTPDALRAEPLAHETPATEPRRAAALLNRPMEQTLVKEIDTQAALPSEDNDAALPSPSTRASAMAEYLVGWRQRVERVGTANFPQRFLARADLGRPTLEVAIGPEGRLLDIVVRRSSGDTTLDQAALKILRLAAPFEPLPASVLAEHDVLRFAYEWDFSAGAEDLATIGRAALD
jgi:protein TonB